MSVIAPTLQAFFTERLVQQRGASPCTMAAYRSCFRLLLRFVHQRCGKEPSQMAFDDLGATAVAEFLQHLENERGNGIRSRNARLAAVHSFFKFAAYRHPEHAELIQRVLAIPPKRFERAEITHLDHSEIVALLAAPDRETWHGRRDHALLLVAVQTGLRLSELTALRIEDAHLGGGAHLRCVGKGRKCRCTPLNAQTVAVLKVWLRERGGVPGDALFPTRRGTRLSADAMASLVAKHTQTAARSCRSLQSKKVTPHVLRHTNSMQLLQSGVDTATIALWLGHESVRTTDIYLHADMSLKERALGRLAPPSATAGRYRPPDTLMTFLASP